MLLNSRRIVVNFLRTIRVRFPVEHETCCELVNKNNCVIQRHFYTRAIRWGEHRDPTATYFSSDVQKLLRNITGFEMDKVFKPKKYGVPLKSPKYQFMTKKELEKARTEALKRGKELLQPPPFLSPRSEPAKVINFDPELQGYDKYKFVFIDISLKTSKRNINICVRESNGLLRTVDSEERTRLTKLYFPTEGQDYLVPPMFLGDNINAPLSNKEYIYLLDRACVQFEPDDPIYVQATRKVYDWIDEKGHHGELLSTRHCSPMAFYLAWNRKIDRFLLFLLKSEMLERATDLVRLFYSVNEDLKQELPTDPYETIELFINSHSNIKGLLEVCLKAMKEIERNRQEQLIGVQQAHGH